MKRFSGSGLPTAWRRTGGVTVARALAISDVGRAVELMDDQQRAHLAVLLRELDSAETLVVAAKRELDRATVALEAASTAKQRRLNAIEALVSAVGGAARS